MLVVKTGMAPEYDIATAHFPNAMHLTGGANFGKPAGADPGDLHGGFMSTRP
jgi:hypothetical protein